MNIIKEALKVFDLEIEELKKVRDRIDGTIEEAAKLIINCKGKVVVTGIGKSGLIGKKIASTMSSTGTLAVFMNSAEGLHGDLGTVDKNDVVIAISNSGNSDEVVSILPVIKKIGAKIIGMTGNKNSRLAKNSDVILDIGVEKEACPMELAPTSSTTATLVMGDALSVVLIIMRDFKPENFALYHPGGSLGRRLLLRVKDIMHSGDKLAILGEEANTEDIIVELTEKKLGGVCILDENKKFLGIITEGDIRRALKNKEEFFNLKAKDIMTKNPTFIEKNQMAIDALELMENRDSQISVLPVLEFGNLVGMIRVHDLLGKIK